MTSWILVARPCIETLIAIGLFANCRQLLVIKKVIRLRNDRGTKKKAIEACVRYFDAYVPMANKDCLKRSKEDNLDYERPLGESGEISVWARRLKDANTSCSRLSALIGLNQLESIAASFTSGVADEGTGFRIIGRTYCFNVESYYELISVSPHAYWQSVIDLYFLWRPRLSAAELEIARGEMKARLSMLTDSEPEQVCKANC
jgi:hypothetical protein